MALARAAETGVSSPRLAQLLGPAAILLHPIRGLLLLLLGCLPLLPFASQPLGIPLAALSSYVLLMAVRLEQPWLAISPFPPLTVLCLGAWLRCGLGGILIALGEPMSLSNSSSGFWRHLPEAQLLWLVASGTAVVVFAAWPRQPRPPAITSQEADRQSVVALALACGVFALVALGIGVAAGTLDRNPSSYFFWVSQRWRPDSLFTMFARFREVFFLLAPLAIWKTRSTWIRMILVAILFTYTILALPLGGRGLLLYPLIYTCAGLWLTNISIKTFRLIICFILAISLMLIPSIAIYRSTNSFNTIRRDDFSGRLGHLGEAIISTANQTKLPTLMTQTGISIYGCSEGFLFQDPAASRPRAGWHRMESLLTAWLPELVVPKKIPVRDGHIIAEEARGRSRQEAESMIYTSHHCISMGGDLYWRGGWPIVALGSILTAIFYRIMSGFWYLLAGWESSWKILILLYPCTFLTMYPFGSIGETAWIWMWDLPKYVVLVGLIYVISARLPHKPLLRSR
jgi:hypothetical protein